MSLHEVDIPNIKQILKAIDDRTYNQMINKAKEIYEKYFTLDAVCKNIASRLVSE